MAPEARESTDEIATSVQPMDVDDPKDCVRPASSSGQEHHQFKQDVIRSTPEAQTGVELQSPQTEEVPRVAGSALAIFLPENPSPSLLAHAVNLDFLEAHATILKSLQAGVEPIANTQAARPGTIWTAAGPTAWSAEMWTDFLAAGEARSQKSIILNMIGYIWATQTCGFPIPVHPPKGRRRRRARETEKARSRKQPFHGAFYPSRKIRHVSEEADHEFERRLTEAFETNSQMEPLLRVLDEQINILVQEGRTNLAHFFTSLESKNIVPLEEVIELRAKHGYGTNVTEASLNADADSLVPMLHQMSDNASNGSFTVRDAVELTIGSFDRLRPGKWLDMWLIAAAMELSDKPSCVKYGLGIPLDQEKEGKIISIERPFNRWKRKIDEYRRSVGDEGKQVYVCPVNIDMSHFTLLEINEQLGMIYHYDSMATSNAIRGRPGRTRVRRLVEAEFKDLGFGYEEAPCPQQNDSNSYGLMVIRNARRRMNGREVGGWGDVLDHNLLLKDVVDLLKMGIENDAVRPRPARRMSKRKAEATHV